MMTETQRARRLEQIREGLELAREFHPSRQLKMLNWIFGDVNVAIENNVRRVAQRNLIARIAADNNGNIGLIVWSRDCDMCESTNGHVIKASEFNEYVEDLYYNAEGPCNVTIVTVAEAEAFESSFRDRALEAFEDGHPHVIYG